MALSFGVGLGGPTIGISTPLLDEDKQPTTIVHHHHYPLTEAQADLYMQQSEYIKYLAQKIQTIYFYRDKNKVLQPIYYRDIKTREIRRLTISDIEKRGKRTEAAMRKEDKAILMTKGIGGLEEAEDIWAEETDKEKSNFKCYLITFGIIFPFCLPVVCCILCGGKETGALKDIPDIYLYTKDENTGKVSSSCTKACMKKPISID